MFALEKPKPKQSTPCDEWISKIAPLAHIVNEKAKSYAVGFFNGDIKVYSSEHAELLNVSQLHYNAQVSDMLYFKSDTLDANIVVSCSEQPDPQLIVAKLGADKKPMKRARTSVPQISPIASLRCPNGVQSMSWASQSVLIAGCTDHQVRVFDMERQ